MIVDVRTYTAFPGKLPAYFAALKAYQTGERQHPTMHANAFSLSAQDQQDIAAYLAGVKTAEAPSPIRGNATAGKTKSVACAACHGPCFRRAFYHSGH